MKNGYNAFVAAENPQAVLYDLEYIPIDNCDQLETYLSLITYKMNSDIIICGFNLDEKCKLDKLYTKLDIDIEMIIPSKEQPIEINLLGYEGNPCSSSCKNYTVNSVEEIFKYIEYTLNT